MSIKAAFIFISSDGDPDLHHSQVDTAEVSVSTFAVSDYAGAGRLAKKLVEQGFTAIELCGGFGTEGVAIVKRDVSHQIAVGVVRFDCHPGFGFKSGDEVFKN